MKPHSSSQSLALMHAECFVMPRPWSAREFEGLLADHHVFCCDDPKGFAIGRTVLDEAELLTLAVALQHRRQGAGRKLLARFEAEAVARGATHAFLEVAATNSAALTLYRAAGYQQSGRRKGYFTAESGEKIDALILTRALDPASVGTVSHVF